MNKLPIAAGIAAAAAAAAFAGVGSSTATPASNSTLNVVGEPYAKAVAILRAQGVPASFGGSVGSDVPQALCIVSSQKVLGTGKMVLMLDCTAEAQPEQPSVTSVANTPTSGAPGADSAGRPTLGATGVVTVVPTPVG